MVKPKDTPPASPPSDSSKRVDDAVSILAKLSDKEAADWLVNNESNYTATEKQEIFAALDSSRGPATTANLLDQAGLSREGAEVDLVAEATQQFGNSTVTGKPPSADLNNDGRVTDGERSAFDKAKQKAINDQASQITSQTGASSDVAQAAASSGIESIIAGGTSSAPSWITSSYLGSTGTLSAANVKQILDAWNEYNPTNQAKDATDLWAKLQLRTPGNEAVVQGGLNGTDPQLSYTVTLNNGRQLTVDAAQLAAFHQTYGDSAAHNKDLVQYVRLADSLNVQDPTGNNGWQILAALTSIAGGGPSIFLGQPNVDGAGASQTVGKPGSWTFTDPDAVKAANAAVTPTPNDHEHVGVVNQDSKANNVVQMAMKYQTGQMIYKGNTALAFLYAVDPTATARLANTPQRLWTDADWGFYTGTVGRAGIDPKTLAAMGFYGATDISTFKGPGGTNTLEKQKLDAVKVQQAAKDLYRQLFLVDPTPAQLSSLVSTVQSAYNSNTDPTQTVDPDARLRAAEEALPQYKELYGNKPSGMTEQDYQAQFRNGAASLLGSEAADPAALRSGMKTGEYQTTVGQVAGSKQAWANSTFLGRLAAAGQVVSENT